MKWDELKPVWKSYKEQADSHNRWSETQLQDLLSQHTATTPQHKRAPAVLLNLAVFFLLIGITGC